MKTIGLVATAAAAAIGLIAAAAPAAPQPMGYAGSWTQQSRGKELVLVPKIKLQPSVGVGAGTSLGGSVGYGSMTRTAIVTEPTMLEVQRSMKLAIAADGSFSWTSVVKHADGANCVRTTRREKRGRASLGGATLTFAVAGGTESFEKSCGGRGSSAIAPATERYPVSFAGGRMQLTDGAARWIFTRG